MIEIIVVYEKKCNGVIAWSSAIVTAGLLFATLSIVSSAAQSDEKNNNNSGGQVEDRILTVKAGDWGPETVSTSFAPKHAEIKVGETIMWVNPTRVGEPHTITFMNDENLK